MEIWKSTQESSSSTALHVPRLPPQEGRCLGTEQGAVLKHGALTPNKEGFLGLFYTQG